MSLDPSARHRLLDPRCHDDDPDPKSPDVARLQQVSARRADHDEGTTDPVCDLRALSVYTPSYPWQDVIQFRV